MWCKFLAEVDAGSGDLAGTKVPSRETAVAPAAAQRGPHTARSSAKSWRPSSLGKKLQGAAQPPRIPRVPLSPSRRR